MARGYNKSIGNNIDFSGKCTVTKETKAELEAYVKEKMEIIDDFCVGRHKLSAKEKKELRQKMLNIKSASGIDIYFRTFIDSRI
jgi:hypothetical protein